MNGMKTGRSAFPVLLLMLVVCGCTQQSETGKLQVVTSIEPLSYFAGRIGGRHVAVSVMVPPGGNPHSYEPSPRQMARLGHAALFIKAGSGVAFELDWMQRFLSLNPGLRVCDASLGVPLISLPLESEEKGNHHDRFDPHYWLSPENGIVIANNIARSLAEADPANQSTYEENRQKLVAELHTLDREIRQNLAGIKHRKFLVFHPAWGYYAAAFRLEQIAAEEEGKTLTPRQMQLVIAKARASRIRVVFVSPQFSTSQAETIADEIGGVTRIVDPLSADYQGNLRRATATFISSMQ